MTPIDAPMNEKMVASPPTANDATAANEPRANNAAPIVKIAMALAAAILTIFWFLLIHSITPDAARLKACTIVVTLPSSDSPMAIATPSMEDFRIRNAPPSPPSISSAVLPAMPPAFCSSEYNSRVSATLLPIELAAVMPSRPNTSFSFSAFSAVPIFSVAAATSPRTSTSDRALPLASLVVTPKVVLNFSRFGGTDRQQATHCITGR